MILESDSHLLMAYRAAAVSESNAWCCSAAEGLDWEAAWHPLRVQLHHRPSESSAGSYGGVCGRQGAGGPPGVPSARQRSCGAMPRHLSQGRRLAPQGCPALPGELMCPSKPMARRPPRTWHKRLWVLLTHSFACIGSGDLGGLLLLQSLHEQNSPCSLFWMA